MRITRFALPLLMLSAPLAAEPGLPDTAAVKGVLDEHPSVVAARHKVEAAMADARARAKGPHEFTLSGGYDRRRIDLEGEFDEYSAELTRGVRLPGKAAIDREIGQYGVAAAKHLAEDAKHQAALLLAGHWFDWLGASARAAIDRQAVANYEAALSAVRRRIALRDASELDADQTAAALGSARAMAEESAGRAALARRRLETHFPGLPLPAEAPDLPQPQLPEGGLDRLRDLVLSESHELAAAEAEAQRMASLAERARRERIADPSIGVRIFSERGGSERGAGLIFSVPLGGGNRRAQADQAAATASAARSEERLAHFTVTQTAEDDLAEARYTLAVWQRAREGLEAQTAALTKMRRGQELGEIDLADRLLAERMVHDAFRGEVAARTEALRAITKLRIDSHDLWLAD
ncbi:MAG TPA: TolC family protein [Sphingobium sp.]|nr:TolC family protein [Sphingobium sp.]